MMLFRPGISRSIAIPGAQQSCLAYKQCTFFPYRRSSFCLQGSHDTHRWIFAPAQRGILEGIAARPSLRAYLLRMGCSFRCQAALLGRWMWRKGKAHKLLLGLRSSLRRTFPLGIRSKGAERCRRTQGGTIGRRGRRIGCQRAWRRGTCRWAEGTA